MEKEIKWYELDEKDRINKVFTKYTIQDFWDWWSNKEQKIMEVRITDVVIIKETAYRFQLPYSMSGVYVQDAQQLKNVIAFVRNRATMWFGINPRCKNWNRFGTKGFGSGGKGGSSTENVAEVGFIFVDVDRVIKKKEKATKEELKNTDVLTEKLLERLEQEKWNKGFMKLCSGNGTQLVVKLDFPIKMPTINFDDSTKTFIPNDEFEKMKSIIAKGIGAQIITFCNKIKDELGVEVDKAGFRIAQVAALHCTKNYKYGGYTWRGIVELKDKPNVGLSDYVLSKEEDVMLYKAKNVFTRTRALGHKHRMKQGKLGEHPLVRFMLDNDFPSGGINNTLWFQMKVLIRDSKIDMSSKEFLVLHRQLCQKHRRTFTTNLPEKKFQFDENIVNAFCIRNCIAPLYLLWPSRNKRMTDAYNLGELKNLWDNRLLVDKFIQLGDELTIQDDMRTIKSLLKVGAGPQNRSIMTQFINGCIKKYNEKRTEYYHKYLFDRFFNYS